MNFLAIEDDALDITIRLEAAQTLYLYATTLSDERRLAEQALALLLQRSDLSIDQARQTAVSLYYSSPEGSEARVLATSMLTTLVQRSDLSIDQAFQTAESLYQSSPEGSEAELLAISILLALFSNSYEPEGKEDLYGILKNMIPQFHNLPLLNMPPSSNL